MRIMHAGTGAIELQPMIAAFHAVALDPAEPERRETMRTAVGERHRLAVALAVKNQRSVENPAAEELVAQLVRPGGHVPGVSQISHRTLLHRMILPPSTVRVWPVIKPLADDSRN